jgi:hypothetical protein
LRDSAEQHFRAALATNEKELPRQPADRVEIYLRLSQALASSHRKQAAADVARQGLDTAGHAYGAFFSQHPFVTELRDLASSATLVRR